MSLLKLSASTDQRGISERDDETLPKLEPLPVEWFSEIRPQLQGMWLVRRLLPAQGLALIYGHPGSGKSFFALDLALHISLGWNWCSRPVKQGLVIYVGAEGGHGLRNRITAFRRFHEVEGEIPFALIPAPIDMQDPDADTERLAQTVRRAAEITKADPALIIIDTLSKTFGAGKENTDDMATYIANCQRIASEFNCLVMPVHHRPKDAESTEPRGHGSLKGGVDTVILIQAGKGMTAEVTKQKDGETGEKFPFNLNVVELGTDEDGDVVTSCIVAHRALDRQVEVSSFDQKVGKLSAGTLNVYEELNRLIVTDGVLVPDEIPDEEVDRDCVRKVIPFAFWRDKCISSGGTEPGHNRDTGKRNFNRRLGALRKAGIVGVWGSWAWIIHQRWPHRDRDRTMIGTIGGHGDNRDKGL